MKGFWTSSIGKKLLMSLSGLFLIVFLLVHLVMNLTMLFDPVKGEVYNLAANFMGENPVIKIIEPVLVIGFFVHIFYGFLVQVINWKSRGNSKYAVVDQKDSSSWASRNMIWLGIFIFGFLIIHVINFLVKLETGGASEITIDGEQMHDTFKLVVGLFEIWWYDVIYIISFIALGLHLHHAFWSAFQTIGFSNKLWLKRLQVIGDIYTYIIVIGFSIIPLYFLIF